MSKISFLPVIILIIVSLLLDWYVYQGIKTIATHIQHPQTGQFIQGAWWLLSILVLSGFVYLFYRAFPQRKTTGLFSVALNTFLTLLVTRLVFVLVLLGEDIYRLGILIFNLITGASPAVPARSLWFSSMAVLIASVPFFAFIFGIRYGKYRYRVRRTMLYFEDLPAAFDKFTIAQISDIHAGSFDNPEAVERGIQLLNAQKADLFVFTGDLVNNRADEILPYIDIFNKVEAPYGRYSILGNHDYGDYITWKSIEEKALNLSVLKQYHQQLGYRLLLDEHVLIKKDGQQFALLGVENWGRGFGKRGKLKQALDGIEPDAFKVLLSHDPTHWETQVKKNPVKIHLTLSGHTHGMQFGIEIGKFKWSPAKYRYPNWAGLIHESGRYLYVNRGFGFLGFAGRVGIWPEITIIELRRAT